MFRFRKRSSVRKLNEPPYGSSLADWFADSDFQDSYAVWIDHSIDCPIHDVVAPALAAPPLWLRCLFSLRDALVRPFGVMTTDVMRQAANNQRIDFFRVRSETSGELILGEDDRHLDFRVSFLKRREGTGDLIVATTVVRIKSGFGRAYLFLILPFHRLIVRKSLRRLVLSLQARNETRPPPHSNNLKEKMS